MSRTTPLSATVFAVLGATLLVTAAILALPGSFAFLAVASVGMFFVAAALISRAAGSTLSRAAAVLALAGVALVVFGTVATPFFYAGWGLIAGAAMLALIGRRRSG